MTTDSVPRGRRLRLAFAAMLLAAAIPPQIARAADDAPGMVEALVRQSAAADPELSAFYRGRDYRPLWIRSGDLISESRRLVSALRDLGMNQDAAALQAAVSAARDESPMALAQAEMRLSRALLAYADDVPTGVDVGMNYIDRELAPERSELRSVNRISSRRDLRRLIDSLDEGNPVYVQLRRALADYRLRWGRLPAVRVPTGSALRAGARGTRVQALRRRLGLGGRGTFDAALAQAARDYQRAHGLPVNGVADRATIASLNHGPAHYERLIRANLARARALPADPGRRFIVVDAAAARLWMYEDGRVVDSMRVIVGKPSEQTQTPMMAAMMRFANLNPYWNVPPDLARNNIAPNAIRRGAAYLRERGYEVLSDWSDNAHVVHPTRVNWDLIASGRQEARVRQRPGPGNMMGRVKLMMPNRFGIYLHDTPDRDLFNEPDRRLSSGCIRLEDAFRLTRWVFGRDISPRTGQPDERINLRRPIPVFVTYMTAGPVPGGVEFRADVYNRDPALLAQLDRAGGARQAQAAR